MKLINKILIIVLSILSLFLAIYKKDITFLYFVLYLNCSFILKLNSILNFIYIIFGFLTMFLGNSLSLFRTTSWYDTFTHLLWGIISSLFAIYILDKLNFWNYKNLLFNIIFILSFALASSALWEIGEFLTDTILNTNTQRRDTGVYDTMKDIIAALLGNLLFTVYYIYESKVKHKFINKLY